MTSVMLDGRIRGVGALGAALLAVVLAACEGRIGDSYGRGDGSGPGGPGRYTEDAPVPGTRTARLSHEQWDNAVVDLLRLDGPSGVSASFRADPAQSGFLFGNNAETLEVDQALWGTYQRAAENLAERVTSDAAQLALLLPVSAGTDEERARAFIVSFGQRAHRRPLADGDVDAYLALWSAGRTAYSGVPPLEAGLRLVLEAMLQSPWFLYRVETSSETDDDVIPLDDWEVASRLSFMLWNTMPDDELFAVAAQGALREAGDVAAQVDRMLADPRATDVVARFHEILFDVPDFAAIAPSPAFFPDVSHELGALVARENDLFVRDVFERGGGVRDLLTSTETFVNAELARIYGVPGDFGDEMVPVSLDPSERKGILTHLGFLARNATSVNPDPIHRGVFVARRIACIQVAAPPANVPPLPPLDGSLTTRQAVEAHTQQEGSICATCHERVINRFGFAFERYDAIGAVRTEDAGQPIDSATEPPIDGSPVPVRDGVELAERLAGSRDVHACYAQHWIEFAYGRPRADRDEPLIDRLGARSLEQGLGVRDLLVELATSRAFLNRSAEELP